MRFSLIFCALAVGCSPALHPLYRDYEVQASSADVRARIEQAFLGAGWTLVEGAAPNAVTTGIRQLRNWGLYSVVVQLEAVPVGDMHVRLFVHPYREYVTGSRSKIPFLKGRIRRSVIRELDLSFAQHNLKAVGTDITRDRVRQR